VVSKAIQTQGDQGGSPLGSKFQAQFPHLRRRRATAVIEATLPKLDRFYDFNELATDDDLYYSFEKALKSLEFEDHLYFYFDVFNLRLTTIKDPKVLEASCFDIAKNYLGYQGKPMLQTLIQRKVAVKLALDQIEEGNFSSAMFNRLFEDVENSLRVKFNEFADWSAPNDGERHRKDSRVKAFTRMFTKTEAKKKTKELSLFVIETKFFSSRITRRSSVSF